MLTFRELPFEEWHRLIERGIYPYVVSGLPQSNEHWRMFVVERDGEIVGSTAVHTQVHWDPWWIADGEEGLAVVRGLVRLGHQTLKQHYIDHVFCTIGSDQPVVRDMAERLGFTPAPGQLYLLDVAKLD